jgi:hypothetical protein
LPLLVTATPIIETELRCDVVTMKVLRPAFVAVNFAPWSSELMR